MGSFTAPGERHVRSSEPVQESIARLLDSFDIASPVGRRALYEQALFLQYGRLRQLAGNDQELLVGPESPIDP